MSATANSDREARVIAREVSFRHRFLEWLDQNQDALEAGGTGDVRALMNLLSSSGDQASLR